MAHEEKMLCPFKKAITREQDRKTSKVEFRERFEPCARERCMAWSGSFRKRCLRLENNETRNTR